MTKCAPPGARPAPASAGCSRLVDDWHDARIAPAMHLLVGGNTDGVVIYSINDGGAAVASLPFPTYINEIRVSPDSTQFVALGDTDDIFFVDIICTHGTATYARRCKREFEPPTPAHHPHPGGFSAAWSSNSKRVAVLRESPGVVNVLDVATLDVLAVLNGDPGEPLRVVAYDDQFVALAELRGNIWIYDAKTFAVCQRIDLLQLHARVWNSVVPSSEMVVFADQLDSPENVARADAYLREHRANNGASGEFLPAAVRYARYLQARKSGITRRTPFDNRCHGMVLVPGMLIVGRPNIVVLHARRVPTLAAVASAFVVACRRVDHENDRRLVLYDWCMRAARRLVKAHNDVIQRARRRRIASATERYEAQQLSSSTSAASLSTRSDSAGLTPRVPSQSRRLQATAFAGAALSSSRANLQRARRTRTTDDIDTEAARVRRVPTQPRVVGLANPMQSATTVPLLDFELGDVLAFRDMHRVLLSRFGVAFWQVTADDFVMFNKVGDIISTCLRMLSNCIVREQAAERFEGSPCLPPTTASTTSSDTSTTNSTTTSTTTSTTNSTTNSYAGSSNSLLAGSSGGGMPYSHGRMLFEAWGRHRSQFVQLLQTPPTSATSTVTEVAQPPPLPSPTTRQRTLEAIRAPDDLPAMMTVAEALEQLAPLVLLPQCDMDLSGLSRSMRNALQRAASTTHCSAPYVTFEAVKERNVVASDESDGGGGGSNYGSDDEVPVQYTY
jgi:hypothetical protein